LGEGISFKWYATIAYKAASEFAEVEVDTQLAWTKPSAEGGS
jgi:hypothetical protein